MDIIFASLSCPPPRYGNYWIAASPDDDDGSAAAALMCIKTNLYKRLAFGARV